jgi:hypothetical protein
MPAAIRQRLLDNHLHPPKCDDNRWGDGGFRRYRDEWAQGVAPLLPALRLTADHRARPDPGSDDGQGWDLDSNEWFRPVWELFVGRRRPWVGPVLGAKQIEANPEL